MSYGWNSTRDMFILKYWSDILLQHKLRFACKPITLISPRASRDSSLFREDEFRETVTIARR